MCVKDLKQKIANVADDIEVKICEEDGVLIDVNYAYVDEDDSGKSMFVISH